MSPILEVLRKALGERYEITREIGAGGMAVVYAATDRRHGRQVAVKTIRPDIATGTAADRFLREIQVAAGLLHPHILPLLDSGAAGEVLYYTMPLVEGESLRSLLGRERQLGIPDALRLTREIADALEYAHGKGILHRDIKPENILLHNGRALVCDFGLAVALDAAPGTRLTEAGMRVGTPEYMSPEHAAGSPDLDCRADIYSLGCILHEMLAGEPPFTGPNAMAIFSKAALDPTPSVRRVRDTVPDEVDVALRRALAKVPADRFASARDFVEALDARHPPPPKSVAVLPFANLSSDPENEYFSDGVTEDLIAQLAKMADVKVISRTSVMRFKGRTGGPREVGRELGVATVLEGSVRRDGDRVRITAQLIDAQTEQHLWSEQFDRQLTDIFAIQSEVAQRIATALHSTLSPSERTGMGGVRHPDLEAYNLHLMGRFHTGKWSAEGWRIGLPLIEKAIARDPSYAAPHATLAVNYAIRAYMGAFPPATAFAAAEKEARLAIALDDTDADAHYARGLVHYLLHWDWGAARRDLERACQLSPSDSAARSILGSVLDTIGQFNEGMSHRRRAAELSPLDATAVFNLGFGHYIRRAFPDAIAQFSRALDLDAGNAAAIYGLGMAQVDSGQFDAAIRTFERGLASGETSGTMKGFCAWAYAAAGRSAEARRVLVELTTHPSDEYVSSYHVALIHLGLRQLDEAFGWFDRAVAERASWLVFINNTPTFDVVRNDPRFADLLKRLGLPATFSRAD